METQKLNPETQTTKFINVDSKAFDIYVGGQLSHHLEAGEEKVLPLFVAKLGAKHLTDRILQEKGVKDSNRPSPERDKIISTIIPEAAEQAEIKPLTEEEFRARMEKRVEEQASTIASLGGRIEEVSKSKDEEIAELKRQLEATKKVEEPKVARKPKST